MLAMILAGGRGSRLHELTNKVAKPAVGYGGKYRIVDFPLSNCANSGIDVVGVLTQYESVLLNSYVAAGGRWGLDAKDSGVYVLPPREKADAGLDVYRGTADAISQNIDFIDSQNPEYLLILSGDHIYKMNYAKMLDDHIQHKADATIAVIEVPMKEASRFGIMKSLWICGVLQGLTTLVFVVQAYAGHDIYVLIGCISLDNISGGMCVAAFVAYMSTLCNVAYTATQYALLSSLMSFARDVCAATSGLVAAMVSWDVFFIITSLMVIPGLVVLYILQCREGELNSHRVRIKA